MTSICGCLNVLSFLVLVFFLNFALTEDDINADIVNEVQNYKSNGGSLNFARVKRQLENFDEEYPTAANSEIQEEPSFWDRVVKVALKLFSKFVEWLNN